MTPPPLACVGARRTAIARFDAIVVGHKPHRNVLASWRASSTRSARRQSRVQETRCDGAIGRNRDRRVQPHLLRVDVKLETSLICHHNLQDLRLGVHRVIGERFFPTTDGGPYVIHYARVPVICCIGNIVVVLVVTPERVAAFAIQPFALFEELVCYGVCRIGICELRGVFREAILHHGKSAEQSSSSRVRSRRVESSSWGQCEREEGLWGGGDGGTPWIFGLLTFVPIRVNLRLLHTLGEPRHLVSPDTCFLCPIPALRPTRGHRGVLPVLYPFCPEAD